MLTIIYSASFDKTMYVLYSKTDSRPVFVVVLLEFKISFNDRYFKATVLRASSARSLLNVTMNIVVHWKLAY